MPGYEIRQMPIENKNAAVIFFLLLVLRYSFIAAFHSEWL